MFSTWATTFAWFDSEFVFTAIPWLVGAWGFGYMFGSVLKVVDKAPDWF